LALNWSEKFRRFVTSEFLHQVGIHLNRLSDFAGPLQTAYSQNCRYMRN